MYDDSVVRGNANLLASVVAFYGKKPASLHEPIFHLHGRIRRLLGDVYLPYDLEQVHATIIGIESISRGEQLLNSNFLTIRNQAKKVELKDIIKLIQDTDLLPMNIQIGGFRSGVDYGFLSQGMNPTLRSFSLRGGIAVGIGWPTADGQYPDSLNRLRTRFQTVNALHKYHKSVGDVDNDLFFVMGRCSSSISERRRSNVELDVRAFLAANPCVVQLGRSDISIVCYSDRTLPTADTVVLQVVGDSSEIARSIRATHEVESRLW